MHMCTTQIASCVHVPCVICVVHCAAVSWYPLTMTGEGWSLVSRWPGPQDYGTISVGRDTHSTRGESYTNMYFHDTAVNDEILASKLRHFSYVHAHTATRLTGFLRCSALCTR